MCGDRGGRQWRCSGNRRRGPSRHAGIFLLLRDQSGGLCWHFVEECGTCLQAAEALKFTSKYLRKFGVIDAVIEEPLGGAHRDHHQMASRLKMYLSKTLRELQDSPLTELVEKRYEKFRAMGVYLEDTAV